MQPQVATTPQELQAAITELRRLIAVDKKLYVEFRAWMWPGHPNEWAVVEDVLRARSRWYLGEIVRAKHNVARYMRGEDLTLVRRYVEDAVSGVENELYDLQNAIVDWTKVGDKEYGSEEVRKAINEMCVSIKEIDADIIKRTTNILERHTYGG